MLIDFGLAIAVLAWQAAAPASVSAGHLAGRVVVEGTGAPIAGAQVMLMPGGPRSGPMGPPPQALTDQGGRFAFDNLAPGEYRVSAQKTGYALDIMDTGRRQTVRVAPGQPVDGIVISLQRGGVVTGRILDAAGEPVPDVRVMAMRRMNGPPAMGPRLVPAPGQSQQTNDIGEYRISGLSPGEYFIAAMPRMSTPFGGPAVAAAASSTAMVTTFYPGTSDQVAARAVTVQAGETINGIEFAIQSAPAFRVAGRVVDENDAPVEGAMVMLTGDPRSGAFMGPVGNARTGSDGRFAIAGVPAGAYRLNASVPMIASPAVAGSAGSAAPAAGIGAVSGGFSSFTTFSVNAADSSRATTEIAVSDADVTGVRLVVRRPQQ